MDNTLDTPAILSLCSGGLLGLERGIESVLGKLRVAAYVEIETFLCWNLVKQMEQGILDSAAVWTNVKTFPAHFFHNRIHIITAGYPCQPFSIAGLQQGIEDYRHLFPFIASIVDAVKPPVLFFENVPGHLTIGYREVRLKLEGFGYTVKEGLYSAAEVGAPHERLRLFILGILGNPSWHRWLTRDGIESKHSREINNKKSQWSKKRNRLEQSSQMADSNYQREQQPERLEQEEWQRAEYGGITLDNPDLSSTEYAIQARRNATAITGESMVNSFDNDGFNWQERNTGIVNHYRFPSPPGQPQYEWEEPRLESKLGFTAHGYNFKEDLLRMAGNGVVQQTAALAFRDLLRQHGIE